MSVSDDFLQRIGAAIADIRQRVVEEPWFGRVVTDSPAIAPAEPEPLPSAAEGIGGMLRRSQPTDVAAGQDLNAPDLERG